MQREGAYPKYTNMVTKAPRVARTGIRGTCKASWLNRVNLVTPDLIHAAFTTLLLIDNVQSKNIY